MKTALVLAALVLLAAALKARAASSPAAASYVPWASPAALFSCDIPAGWKASGDKDLLALGKRRGFGVAPLLSVSFYENGKGSGFASADDYLDEYMGRERKGDAGVRALMGAAPAAPRKVRGKDERKAEAGGLPATRFELDETSRPEHVEPHDSARAVVVKNSFAVVPVEGGFYVLRYAAPAPEYARYAPAFERLLKSFSLKPAKP